MLTPPLAALSALLAVSASAGTARVEVVPELGNIGGAPSASAVLGAAPLQLAPNALLTAFTAPALQVPLLVAPALVTPAALVPVKAVASVPEKVVGHPALIKTLSSPAIDTSKMGAGESSGAAEKDFNARAQLDAPASLGEGVVPAPADGDAPKTTNVRLGHFAKAPFKAVAGGGTGATLELVPTPQGLRALVADGSTRLLTLSADGRWRLSPRESASAYPTPEEVDAAAGTDGRHFIVSKSGLVEWNPNAPKKLAAEVASSLWRRVALRVPLLHPLILLRGGVAAQKTAWKKVETDGLVAGAKPLNERLVIDEVIPALAAEEFPLIAAKLGRKVDAAYRANVLGRTNGYRMYWHSSYTYKDHPDNTGIPDGHFNPKFGIRLMLKPDWRGLKDLSANFRPLFSHEYVHWLQDEGFVSRKYGSEIAAVAVEVLRAIELVGLDGTVAGKAGTVHIGVMGSFEGGREWARTGFKAETTPYLKGGLAGAAYEAAQVTGRPEAAWEFLNLVIAGEGALEPAAAWARVVGSK